MGTFSSNAAIGHPRLNILDGQKVMWEPPWTKEDIVSRLWIDNVDLDDRADVLRGFGNKERHAMMASWRTWDGRATQIKPVVRNLEGEIYGVCVDRVLVEKNMNGREAEIAVELKVGGTEVELVVLEGKILSSLSFGFICGRLASMLALALPSFRAPP
jgi:hypothetical protein